MKTPIHPFLFLTIILLLAYALFGGLNVIELRAEEPRRAIVALEMVLSGNYAVPQINGFNYYNKPPFFNWILAFFFNIFGSFDEWVVRLPSVLSFVATGVLSFFWVKKHLNTTTAFLSSCIFLTSADIFLYGSVNSGEIDLFFTFITFTQMVLLFEFFGKNKWGKMFVFSYFFAAIGTLTKLLGIVYQAFTLLGLTIYYRRLKMLFHWKHFFGMGVFFGVLGIYFYWYSFYENPVKLIANFFNEGVQKSAAGDSYFDIFTHLFTFPFQVLQLLLPWSLLVVFWIKKDFFSEIKKHPLLIFCGIFILSNIILYWLNDDVRNRYLYPFFPFLSILLAHFYTLFLKNQQLHFHIKSHQIIQFLWGLLIVIFTLGMMILPFVEVGLKGEFILLKCAVLGVGFGVLGWFFIKKEAQRVWLVVVFMCLLKIGVNWLYLPTLQQTSDHVIYKNITQDILNITQKEPIFLYGKPYQIEPNLKIGDKNIFEDIKIETASLLPYQIPYYISKHNRHILQNTTSLQKNRWYLAYASEIKNLPVKTYYEFTEKWYKRKMVLMKVND